MIAAAMSHEQRDRLQVAAFGAFYKSELMGRAPRGIDCCEAFAAAIVKSSDDRMTEAIRRNPSMIEQFLAQPFKCGRRRKREATTDYTDCTDYTEDNRQ